jgi:hypothetical protein|tara:strand:- start:2885 stop:3595 length:711 start_codon:yes stop_codon:yes gene_type:complete
MSEMTFDFSPETSAVEYVAPDFRSSYTLQPHVLAELGYPVKVERLPSHSDEVQRAYPSDYEFIRSTEVYDFMFRISYDRDFADYIEDLSAPGIAFGVSAIDHPDDYWIRRDQEILSHHPVQLLHYVNFGRVGEVAVFLSSGYIAHSRDDYPVEKITQQAFMTTFEQLLDLADKYPDEEYDEVAAQAIEEHGNLYGVLYKKGVRSLNPEQMAGIIADYYRSVEEKYPEFRAFKNISR